MKQGSVNITTATLCVDPHCVIPGWHCSECDRKLFWGQVYQRWVHDDENHVCWDTL